MQRGLAGRYVRLEGDWEAWLDFFLEGVEQTANNAVETAKRLNPDLPVEALEDAFHKLTQPQGADLIQRNRALHRLLVDGVTVEYRDMLHHTLDTYPWRWYRFLAAI
jgi:hypothetical protein